MNSLYYSNVCCSLELFCWRTWYTLDDMLDNCSDVLLLSPLHVVLAIIGFNQTTYSVREDAGSVAIRVSVRSGTPVGDVIVTLSTVAGGTARGRDLETALYERESL